jgi:hypothetical protein
MKHSKQKMYKSPVGKCFRDRGTTLHIPTAVGKEDIACCDKVRTLYLVQYIFGNSPVSISAHCNSCEHMACSSSVT